MVVRNISHAKAELSALIQEVLRGNEVILAKAGKPVARLVAYRGPAQPRPADFERKLAGESFESLPLSADHARGVALLPWHHRDPFDRLLIAQAQAAQLTLLTADEIAAAYGKMILVCR